MASANDIFGRLWSEGYSVPDEIYRDYKNIPAITDERAEQKLKEKYPAFFSDMEEVEKPIVPTIDFIVKTLGLEDRPNGGKSATQQFFDDFPKNAGKWKKKIEENPALGKRGWEYVKEAWKTATLDKMNEDIVEARKAYVNGEAEDQGALERIGGFASSFFFPRRHEAFERGDEPTWKDNLGDVAETGLMLVPAGSYLNGVKAVTGAVPKVGKAAKILDNKSVGNIVGNSIAPILSEASDAAIYDEGDENTIRQDFNPYDAIMGAATNMGVNFGLARLVGNGGRILEQRLEGAANQGKSPVVKFAEQMDYAGKPRAERGLGPVINSNSRAAKVFNAVEDAAEMGAPTLLINRYGKDKDADFMLNSLSGITPNFNPAKTLKEARESEVQEAFDRKSSKEVSELVKGLNLDDRDLKYLDDIRKKPNIVKFGHPDAPDDFNLWLLEKGHKLLSGTSLHRPLYEVK